jgi:hypothetical protein
MQLAIYRLQESSSSHKNEKPQINMTIDMLVYSIQHQYATAVPSELYRPDNYVSGIINK